MIACRDLICDIKCNFDCLNKRIAADHNKIKEFSL
jgi:hypothetical protein